MAASRSLTYLSLFGNNIGDEGAKELAEAIRASGSMATLDLSVNKIGDEGAKALAAALRVNWVMINLCIDAFGASAVAINKALKLNPWSRARPFSEARTRKDLNGHATNGFVRDGGRDVHWHRDPGCAATGLLFMAKVG